MRSRNIFYSYNIKIKCIDFYYIGNICTYIVDLASKVKISLIKLYKQDIMYYFNAINVDLLNKYCKIIV
jgi:hypothetical protein